MCDLTARRIIHDFTLQKAQSDKLERPDSPFIVSAINRLSSIQFCPLPVLPLPSA
jgi:hypothetical protein